MREQPLGRSGLAVSAVGLGCNNFGRRLDRAGTRAVIDAALDAGITFLDTADIYGGDGASERLIGEALEGRRDRVVLATKFGMALSGDTGEPRGSRAYARRALEASLERLRTDRVDLLYYHEPDGVTPLAETLGALGELADEGKIRAFGVSNLDADQLREAAAAGDTRLAALQNEYSLIERERRARAAAALPRARHRLRAVLPARQRAADRQVPPRRGAAAEHAAREPAGAADATRRSTASRRSRRSPPSAGTRCSSWRSPGSPRSRASRP